MTDAKFPRAHPKTRVTRWELPIEMTPARERILERAKERGVIIQFDGAAGLVWFEGKASIEVRALRSLLEGA